MLKIRLARHGRKKAPFYRIVLTEHTKPAQSGYQTVLGRFNPLEHKMEAKVDEIKSWIAKGAQLSERVAKLLFAETKDELFKKFFVERTRTKGKEAEEAKKAAAAEKLQAAKEKADAEKAAAEEEKQAKDDTSMSDENEEVEKETNKNKEENTEAKAETNDVEGESKDNDENKEETKE